MGKGLSRIDLDDLDLAASADDETLLQVDEAMQKLAAEDPEKAELVKLRFFVGLRSPTRRGRWACPNRRQSGLGTTAGPGFMSN